MLRLRGGCKDDTSSDEEASMGGGGSQIDDDEPGLQYGSDESDLSDLLDEELRRVQSGDVEQMEFSDNPEEGGEISLNTSAASIVSMEQAEEVAHSIVENILADAQFDGGVQAGAVEGMEFSDSLNTSAASIVSREVVHSIVETILAGVHVEEGEEINSGAKFLQLLDRDYLCSPRMLVRGVYFGEVLKLVVKRKAEGTYVDWTILNMKTNTLVLNVKGEMTYPYALSREAQGTKFGHEVMGGWMWRGYGWGFVNLFPNPALADPTKILHVDIDEAIFFEETIFNHYHLSGTNCMNVTRDEGIKCNEVGCGVRIWSNMFTTYTTVEEVREYYQPRRRRKEKEEQHVYLSLFAFFSGEFKIVLHRARRLKKYSEGLAWFSKDESAKFNDSLALVDRSEIEKSRLIWETNVPKPRSEENTLAAQVAKLIFNEDVMRCGCGCGMQNKWFVCLCLVICLLHELRFAFICIVIIVVTLWHWAE